MAVVHHRAKLLSPLWVTGADQSNRATQQGAREGKAVPSWPTKEQPGVCYTKLLQLSNQINVTYQDKCSQSIHQSPIQIKLLQPTNNDRSILKVLPNIIQPTYIQPQKHNNLFPKGSVFPVFSEFQVPFSIVIHGKLLTVDFFKN